MTECFSVILVPNELMGSDFLFFFGTGDWTQGCSTTVTFPAHFFISRQGLFKLHRLALNFQSCLSLPISEITGMHHWTSLGYGFLKLLVTTMSYISFELMWVKPKLCIHCQRKNWLIQLWGLFPGFEMLTLQITILPIILQCIVKNL